MEKEIVGFVRHHHVCIFVRDQKCKNEDNASVVVVVVFMSPSGLTVTAVAVAGDKGQIGLPEPHGAALETRQAESESNSCARWKASFCGQSWCSGNRRDGAFTAGARSGTSQGGWRGAVVTFQSILPTPRKTTCLLGTCSGKRVTTPHPLGSGQKRRWWRMHAKEGKMSPASLLFENR